MASPCIKLLTRGERGVDLTFTITQVRHLTLSGPGPSLPKERLFSPNECICLLYIFPKPKEVQIEFG